MTEIDVQPKKRGISCLGWLMIGIVVLILILVLMRSCNGEAPLADADADTVVVGATSPDFVGTDSNAAGRTPGSGNDNWNDIGRDAPVTEYDEVTDKNIGVRGNVDYGIYDLGDNILFDLNSSKLKKGAEKQLAQIATSINKRFKGGPVRIYGFSDSTGNVAYNKQLAEERAAAVRNWLAVNGKISASRISLHPIGEGRPVATNTTPQGREQNRRVEIIAKKP